ncbi:M20 family metallopeptidase [Neisseriaceae bacterium TC5R-5]|nr:M20 family metallopeptidase [Neisseriaceae bacterium TC5R-5]
MGAAVLTTQVQAFLDSGELQRTLARRIGWATESQQAQAVTLLTDYLLQEISPALQALGFRCELLDNPHSGCPPFLLAEYLEDPQLPTVLSYGHGDVVFGNAVNWREGLHPWQLVEEGERWYGRGSADNKGQHSINLAALQLIHQARGGRLGFNCKILFEMGEEISSPGLAELCRQYQQRLAADIFIASDGPRLNAERPTLFLGSRGCCNFRLSLSAREQAYHSGNWGGLLSNPATQLANAIACLVNAQGQMQVSALQAPALTPALRTILSDIQPGGQPGDPAIDVNWGEAGLSPAERLFAWNTLEVLSYSAGNPQQPVNAIPPSAQAICQLRFVVGTDWHAIQQHLRAHLDAHGFNQVQLAILGCTPATRFDPTSPLVNWALAIMQAATGKKPALLPNIGGSLPNEVFADILGLPTLWIPHSYPACGQHGVNEHMLKTIASEGLHIMTQLWWDWGEQGQALLAQQRRHRCPLAK